MDIALHITNNPQPARSKLLAEKSLPIKKKPRQSIGENGFRFEFGGNQKVKAVVARKRPVKKVSAQQPPGEAKTAFLLKNGSKNESIEANDGPKKASMAFKRKKSNVSTPRKDDLEIVPRTPEPFTADKPSSKSVPNESGLMLNIFTDTSKVKSKTKALKLSKAERFKNKNANKKVPLKPLTKAELKEGLKKFSINPNQMPRPADIYFQQEKQKREEKVQELKETAKSDNELDSTSNAVAFKQPLARNVVKKVDLFKNNQAVTTIGQRFVKPIAEKLFDGTKIDTMGLHPHSIKNLADLLGITEVTTVQKKTIPKALEGKDLLVRAQTGSGKTLAYALPIVEKLQETRPKITREGGILAVVIVPTRELAIQTYELFQKLVKPFTWIVPGVLMGGEKRKAEKARLRKGINVLVGTPGRLVDHLLHTTSFNVSSAKFLVLDEADRLLEMGYEKDVRQIVEAIDKQRADKAEETKVESPILQRLLLSATLTAAVQKLAGLALKDPIFIDNSDEDPSAAIQNTNGYSKESIEAAALDEFNEENTGILTIPDNLQLSYIVVPPKLRLVTLSGLLAKEFLGKQKFKSMIFMSTMEMVNYHHDLLNEALTQKILDEDDEEENEESNDEGDEPLLKGLRFFKLHGSMTQTERQGVFKSFRECKSGVLLATDVVGRGIDVAEIDLVIQYSPPQKTADFVHRVGRTARAGRSGRATLFLAPNEVQFVRNLEEKRIRISQGDMYIYLKKLLETDSSAHSPQEAASNLQYKFQQLIDEDKELHDKACKAFVSWIKFYNTFPKELKPIFNVKNAHMGHFAKSFGLKEEPKSFVKKHFVPKPPPPTNRLTYTERDPVRVKEDDNQRNKKRMFTTTVTGEVRNRNPTLEATERGSYKLQKLVNKSRTLNISEFDSGLPPATKKRKFA